MLDNFIYRPRAAYCSMEITLRDGITPIHEDTHNQKAYAPRGIGTVESCTLCVHKVDRGDGINPRSRSGRT